MKILHVVLAFLFLPLFLSAQQTESVLDHGHDHGVCGHHLFDTDTVSRLRAVERLVADPERRAQAIERTKRIWAGRALAAVGDVETFYVLNRVTQSFDEISAVLKYNGRLARIWVDARDTSRVSTSVVRQLAWGLDSVTGATSRNPAKGIIENDIEVFGETPKIFEVEGKSDFLMTDIQDGLSGGGYVAGYFSQYDQSNDFGSNARNILYIDSRQGLASGVNSLLNTLAHEFQHLIHYNTNPNSEVFFNEGCSEVASILCGYKTRGNSGYMANTNVRFLGWNYGDTQLLLADYERAMTFVYYLYDQFGEAFLRRFTQTRTNGLTRIDQTLAAIGVAGSYQEVLKGFSVANTVLSGLDDDRYRYDVRISSSTPKASSTYDTLLPATGSVTLQSYGSSNILLRNPTPVSVRFTSTRSFRVMAIVYRASAATEVVEMEGGTTYLLNGDGQATSIVFAVVGLYGSSATINWEANQAPAGLEEGATAIGAALATIVPQPAVGGRAQATVTLPRAGQVRIALFDATGRRVAQPVSEEWVEAGERRFDIDAAGLSTGAYLLRVELPGTAITRPFVVAR